MRYFFLLFTVTLTIECAASELFSLTSPLETKRLAGKETIQYNLDIEKLKVGDSFEIKGLDTSTISMKLVSKRTSSSGVSSIVAIGSSGETSRLTTQNGFIVGSITTQTGTAKLTVKGTANYLLTSDYLSNLSPVSMGNDAVLPKRPKNSKHLKKKNLSSSNKADRPKGEAPIIDLMYVYTQEYAEDQGLALEAQMLQITDDINGFLSASGVNGSFRLVHTQETNFTNDGPTLSALTAIEEGVGDEMDTSPYGIDVPE